MYTSNKDVFNRNGEARRSKKRQELRNLTKMSDEQLEGWAIMFGRNVSHLLQLPVVVYETMIICFKEFLLSSLIADHFSYYIANCQ